MTRGDPVGIAGIGRRTPHVVLVGLPGVGKTTVGRAVAARLGRRFVDMDAEIERSFGKPVSRIFAEDGEGVFRSAEVEASGRLAALEEGLVIAPGGGWVANEGARAHLRGTCRIIYLRVSPDEAVARMGKGIARRPLLASGDAISVMQQLDERRRALYEEAAEMTVETTGVMRAEVVARVVGLVQAAERNFENVEGE